MATYEVSPCICGGTPVFFQKRDPYPDVGFGIDPIGLKCRSCTLTLNGDLFRAEVVDKWNGIMLPFTKKKITIKETMD